MNKKDEIIYDENYIAELYQKMELHLISSLKRNLKRHLNEEKKYNIEYPQWQALKLRELQKVKKENAKIIKNHTSNIPKIISKIIKNEYKQGRTSEQKLYAKLNKNKNKPHLLNESFFNIDNKKVNAIIKELTGTVKESNSAIYRMMNDKYRRTIVDVSFYLEHGVVSIDKAIDMGIKNFIESGINCIEYSNGRRVNIADYTRMAVRTASQRAKLHAEGDYRNSKGLYLVRTTKHYTSCKLCKPWEEKILIDDVFSNGKPDGEHKLLSEAMSKGLLHPNCRHGLPTYYPELDEVYDDIAKGITVEEEIMKLKDDLSQYYQRERRKEVWYEDYKKTLKKEFKSQEIPKTLKLFEKYSKEWEEKHIISKISKEKQIVIKQGIEKLLKENNYCMRVSEESLEKILEEGIFKNQFETNTSGGGVNYKIRKKISEKLFNTKEVTRFEDYEKYGYLGSKNVVEDSEKNDKLGKLRQYGNIIISFSKNKLKNRVTYTITDSSWCEKFNFIGGNATNVNLNGVASKDLKDLNWFYEYFKNNKTGNVEELLEKNSILRYIELQYHGKVTIYDVEKVYFTKTKPNDIIIKKLKSKNIKVFFIERGKTIEL